MTDSQLYAIDYNLPALVKLIYGMTSAEDGFTEAESLAIAEEVALIHLGRIKTTIRACEGDFLRARQPTGANR